uniref:Uncharacterized protein n=1 Tax=viral metagenome TaxID=1070528 RepID=A0A6C0LJ29_9ZZZZ
MASPTLTTTYIFNQYYIDLLKKLKNVAKKHRTHSETAKRILKTIKDNYQTYDKTSGEYIELFKEKTASCWDEYINLEKDKCNDWLKDDNNGKIEIYKDITIKDVVKLLRNDFITHHYLCVLYIYTNELTEEQITTILKVLQKVTEEAEGEAEIDIQNENVKKVLQRLNELKKDNINTDEDNSGMPNMDSLKDTTIGKIAKEIIEDVDLTKLKQSITEEGDIFKAIAKPDSGFGELFTNVSQKMSNKISTGELSQEAIMKDAMKFASMLPGLFGGAGDNNGEGGGGDGGMNMAMNMMNMMMKGGMGGPGGMGGGGKKQKQAVNMNALKKLMQKEKLQNKLKK